MTGGAVPLGDFAVRVDGDRARALAASLGRQDGDEGVPLTYPLAWLAEPGVRAAVLSAAGLEAAGVLPVHIEQRIDQNAPLRAGEAYRLTLALEGPDARQILRVTGSWQDDAGRVAGMLTTGLLLVPVGDRGAA